METFLESPRTRESLQLETSFQSHIGLKFLKILRYYKLN